MQHRIPSQTHREQKAIGIFSMADLAIIGVVFVIVMGSIRTSHLPLELKFAAGILVLLLGAGVIFLRWPPGEGGDKLPTWVLRMGRYWLTDAQTPLRFWSMPKPPPPPKDSDPSPSPKSSSRRSTRHRLPGGLRIGGTRTPSSAQASPASSRTSKAAAATAATTAKIVPFTKIEDGCIQLKDRSWVAEIQVQGILFDSLPPEEQDQIVYNYQGFLHSIHSGFQILAVTEPIRLADEVDWLHSVVQHQEEDALREFGQAVTQLLSEHIQQLEHISYTIAVPGSTQADALDKAERLMRGLRSVHGSLNPRLMDAAEIMRQWAQIFHVPLPGPPSAYHWDVREPDPVPTPPSGPAPSPSSR